MLTQAAGGGIAMVPEGGRASAATDAVGDRDASSLGDPQKPDDGKQKGHGTSGFRHPSKLRQPSTDFEHPDGKVLFGRPASEHAAASSVRAAAQERKTKRSRHAR